MTPSSEKHYFLPFLLATPSSLSRTLEGLFELTRRPSKTRLVRCFRNYRDTRTPSVRLLKTHFLPTILDFEKSTEYN